MWDFWTWLGSIIGTLVFIITFVEKLIPNHLYHNIQTRFNKLISSFYPYVHITFHEHTNDGFGTSKAYKLIDAYLGDKSCKQAERLKARVIKGSKALSFSIDDMEGVTDIYEGKKIWWISDKVPSMQTITLSAEGGEKRYYKLTFHQEHREFVLNSYLKHVMGEGKAVAKKNKQQKLYTNIPREANWLDRGKRDMWSCVVFDHPASFDTLAMNPNKKQAIVNDLITFSKSKDYYTKIGKAWKRGYLLYGPPGTGKSTMVAAMANFLQYDVYDLEMTTVEDNTELRKLLIETTKRAIIVIEDIDCSLNLTGKRENETEKKKETEPEDFLFKKRNNGDKRQVTLSGLLNFIDGLWSAIGGERVIVCTTNHVEKLDPALIRHGRMDMHIELSYCCFEAFKLLAKNYLGIESHYLFPKIEKLLMECEITPANVAEYLMPKPVGEEGSVVNCLKGFINACESKISEKNGD